MLTLIKKTRETNEISQTCKCGSVCFIRSGIGWSCSSCSTYVPAKLEKNKSFCDLKKNLEELQNLHLKLKLMMKELEDMVGKK